MDVDTLDFGQNFTAYPIPANDILNVTSTGRAIIQSVGIYNILGQLLQTVVQPEKPIDLGHLAAGNYVLKIMSDQGNASTKFVKQ